MHFLNFLLGAMMGVYFAVYAALWTTIFNSFAQVGDGSSGDSHRNTYTHELLLELCPLVPAASSRIPYLLCSKDNAATGDSLPKSHWRKRGKRGGFQHRVRKYRLAHRHRLPLLPTILLSNVKYIMNWRLMLGVSALLQTHACWLSLRCGWVTQIATRSRTSVALGALCACTGHPS